MTAHTVSILSAVYNEEKHLQEMIQSVKDQTYSDWELVLVDDDSSDTTVALARQAANGDPRIKVVPGQGKLGKVGAFNRAFQECSGNLIVLMGGDDTMPPTSISDRVDTIADVAEKYACAYFRLRTMSEDPKRHGIVIPKRLKGNRSGGTLIMTRLLAQEMFPIPSDFVAEDIWLSEMVKIHAQEIIERSEVVLNYRIHPGNSNPRGKSFVEMNESIHRRMVPLERILNSEHEMSSSERCRLEKRVQLEQLRHDGKVCAILLRADIPLLDRLRAASMASRSLYALRSRFYAAFSGWS